MRCETERLVLRPLTEHEWVILQSFLVQNREFLAEWEPVQTDAYFEESEIRQILRKQEEELNSRSGLPLYIFLRGTEQLIGSVRFSNIVYGPFQSCFLGYKMDGTHINKGYMTEALATSVQFLFSEFKLHRVEANVMPKNVRSIRVLEKLGFENEGMSRKYLRINGNWEDHIHFVKLNPEVE